MKDLKIQFTQKKSSTQIKKMKLNGFFPVSGIYITVHSVEPLSKAQAGASIKMSIYRKGKVIIEIMTEVADNIATIRKGTLAT